MGERIIQIGDGHTVEFILQVAWRQTDDCGERRAEEALPIINSVPVLQIVQNALGGPLWFLGDRAITNCSLQIVHDLVEPGVRVVLWMFLSSCDNFVVVVSIGRRRELAQGQME